MSLPTDRPAKILIVGNDLPTVTMMATRLIHAGCEVAVARSPVDAMYAFQHQPPDIVILDIVTADDDSVRLCKYVREEQRLAAYIPIVIVTVRTDLPHKIQWLEYGADVYITKPFDADELAAVIVAARRVKRAYDDLRQLTIIDDLTGLFNRRYLFQVVEYELKRARRYGHPLTALMMDLDHFKQVNDRHGHLFGDFVLRETARVLREHTKDTDILARYGGEEFMVLCVETTQDGAIRAAERLREEVARQVFRQADHTAQVNISVGVAGIPAHGHHDGDVLAGPVDALITAADAALFEAKQQGRNRVVVCRPA